MKRYVFMTLFLGATFFLANPVFCQKLRPVTVGLTGKSMATVAFEMSLRRGHFKQEKMGSQDRRIFLPPTGIWFLPSFAESLAESET